MCIYLHILIMNQIWMSCHQQVFMSSFDFFFPITYCNVSSFFMHKDKMSSPAVLTTPSPYRNLNSLLQQVKWSQVWTVDTCLCTQTSLWRMTAATFCKSSYTGDADRASTQHYICACCRTASPGIRAVKQIWNNFFIIII